jgi:hypothetical protein
MFIGPAMHFKSSLFAFCLVVGAVRASAYSLDETTWDNTTFNSSTNILGNAMGVIAPSTLLTGGTAVESALRGDQGDAGEAHFAVWDIGSIYNPATLEGVAEPPLLAIL